MRTTTTQKSSLYCCCFLAFGWRRGWFLRGYTTIKADSLTNESLYVYPGSNQTLKGNGTDQEKQQYLTFPPFHSPTGVHSCCYCGWVVLFFVFLFIIIWGGGCSRHATPHRNQRISLFFYFIISRNFKWLLRRIVKQQQQQKNCCSCKFSLKTRISTRSFF